MHREWMEHPMFRGETYTRAQAWCWLIENANFAPGKIEVKGRIVTVGRGQLRHSLRHLAKLWGWDEARVRRFIARLENENMIRCVVDAGQNLITICNYERYQSNDCVADAPTDAGATQERRNTDAIYKQGNKNNKVGDVVSAPALHDVGNAVLEILGTKNDPRWFGNYAPVQGWLGAGCDPDLDIYPTVRRIMAQRGSQGPPGSMGYFTRAVMQAKADREHVPAEVSPNVRQPSHNPAKPHRGASVWSDPIVLFGEGTGAPENGSDGGERLRDEAGDLEVSYRVVSGG